MLNSQSVENEPAVFYNGRKEGKSEGGWNERDDSSSSHWLTKCSTGSTRYDL